MKIGVRAHDFGKQDVETLASTIKEAGFKCVQLAPTKAIKGIDGFIGISREHLAEIKEAFTKNDVELTVWGCYIEPSIPDGEERRANVEIFKQNLEHAKALGIGIVGTETTHMSIFSTPAERDKAYLRLKDSVLRMVEHAEKIGGVSVGIEPVAEHTLNTPELAHKLVEDINSKHLSIIFDPVNLILPLTVRRQREIFDELFRYVGNKISVVHVKDMIVSNGEKNWCNISTGIIDYPHIMEQLFRIKPHIRLLREGVTMDSHQFDLIAMERLLRK